MQVRISRVSRDNSRAKGTTFFYINYNIHMSNKILLDYRTITSHRKLPEAIESPKFVSHRARMSGDVDSKNIHI